MNHPEPEITNCFVSGVRELVRGQEQQFVDEVQPLVQGQSMRLDLSRIERIDAAGLAALISLCRDAHKAGHEFTIVNPPGHVARILAVVGLDHALMPTDSGHAQPPAPIPGVVAA